MPGYAVSNDMLSEFLDTNDEWITTRTGIKSRNILKDGETLLSLAVEAARRAIENASADPSEIDMVIVSTLQGEFISPAMSCLVAKEIGSPADGQVLMEIRRCGVRLLATAHAPSLQEARRRPQLAPLLAQGVFDTVIRLDGPGLPPHITRLCSG